MKNVFNPSTEWRPPEAPSIQRASCSYNSSYIQLPLDAAPVNADLQRLFAKNARQGAGNKGNMPLSSDTTARSSYTVPVCGPSAGRGISCKPHQEVHVDPSARFTETRSVSQTAFSSFDQKQRVRVELLRPAASCAMGPGMASFEGRTSYDRDYNSSTATRPETSQKMSPKASILQAALLALQKKS